MKPILSAAILMAIAYQSIAQNVGIGTNAPAAKLHVATGNVLFTGQYTGSPGLPPAQSSGTRLMWYPDKAAFRAGGVSGTEWDQSNIGDYSVAMGLGTIASGDYAVALGRYSTASWVSAAAIGSNCEATFWGCTAIGLENIANEQGSTALGFQNRALALGSIAIGVSNRARGIGSVVLGAYSDTLDNPLKNIAKAGDRIFQVGNGTAASRSNALTILRNGNFGINTTNPVEQMEVIGPASTDPVTVVVGNRRGFGPAAVELVSDYGTASQWRPGYIRSADAGNFTGMMQVFTNGTGTANKYGSVLGLEVKNGITYTQTGTVSAWSDERLKENIQPFTTGLDVIEQINPVSFYYNDLSPFKTEREQVGVIAQELEAVAPQMVDKTDFENLEDVRSVNNQAYIFMLINAVKELSTQNKELLGELKQLKARIGL